MNVEDLVIGREYRYRFAGIDLSGTCAGTTTSHGHPGVTFVKMECGGSSALIRIENVIEEVTSECND